MPKKFLVKHVGNMGDMIFFVPPVLEVLKKKYPNCHITFVTAWGFKEKKRWPASRSLLSAIALAKADGEGWGKRNQDGFCIALMMTNPHIDQLVHWHSTALSLEGAICVEEGRSFPTWSEAYFAEQKNSGQYDGVYELDFGLGYDENPMQKIYELLGISGENFTNYKMYFTEQDKNVAAEIMQNVPHPRIMLLETLDSPTTRGWNVDKIPELEQTISKTYGVRPHWFGGRYAPTYQGRPLTLRENIACLLHGDIGIGVLSGPMHFAAAVGLPTITLYADHPIHRAAPAYFLNKYIADPNRQPRTLMGPAAPPFRILKREPTELTLTEQKKQGFKNWHRPGRQATKSAVGVITVDEIMTLLRDMLPV